MRLLRLIRILVTVFRFGLEEIALSNLRSPALRRFVHFVSTGRDLSQPRAVRLRRAL